MNKLARGLSPRVRGNPRHKGQYRNDKRSIPACAGEPITDRDTRSRRRVYPRVCGGTEFERSVGNSVYGLSPRVRGNPHHAAKMPLSMRSIPACAGEPLGSLHQSPPVRVYPRVCGGTKIVLHLGHCAIGLSPRVRGNPTALCHGALPQRSIPACAGEPYIIRMRKAAGEVYPRVCGGTGGWDIRKSLIKGLSPRVRGNPMIVSLAAKPLGSIPACAGEPG